MFSNSKASRIFPFPAQGGVVASPGAGDWVAVLSPLEPTTMVNPGYCLSGHQRGKDKGVSLEGVPYPVILGLEPCRANGK